MAGRGPHDAGFQSMQGLLEESRNLPQLMNIHQARPNLPANSVGLDLAVLASRFDATRQALGDGLFAERKKSAMHDP